MTHSSPGKPATVIRCRKPGHRRHRSGCDDCKRYSNYYRALLIWEKSVGIDRRNVPAEPVRQHLIYLIEHGNRRQFDLAEESGYEPNQICHILAGHRTTVRPLTAETLLALKPRAVAIPPRTFMVPSCEGRRILRGLTAQGWSGPHLAKLMGGVTPHAVNKMMNEDRPWMVQETLTRIRAVAAELGDKDIADGRLPGMDIRVKNNAVRRGWAPFWSWKGRNIADPNAVPRTVDDAGDDPAPTEVAYIDPLIPRLVRDAQERIIKTTAREDRPSSTWIDPVSNPTKLEAHAIAWYGADSALVSTHVGRLLGYAMLSKTDALDPEQGRRFEQEKEAGQRQVDRLDSANAYARAWVQSDPRGETPDWFTPKNVGLPNFRNYLPVLMAMQPAPYGVGWTLEEVAKRAGVTEEEMRAFLAVANREADRPWQPRGKTQPARRPGETRRAA